MTATAAEGTSERPASPATPPGPGGPPLRAVLTGDVDAGRGSAPRTKEEWRRFVEAESLSPVEAPDLRTWRRLSDAERTEVTRARARLAYHSSLSVVATPALQALHAAMEKTLWSNVAAQPGARPGLLVDGPPRSGKSTGVMAYGKLLERRAQEARPDLFGPGPEYIPVVYVSVPDQASPKSLARVVADFLALPLSRSASKQDLVAAVAGTLAACGTELVILDDIHFLRVGERQGRDANDFLKALSNTIPATFVYCGVEVAGGQLFSEGRGGSRVKTQTAGRFAVHRTGALPAGTEREVAAWASVVLAFEQMLRLRNHDVGSLARGEWEYLYARTQGVVGSLSRLLRQGAQDAIVGGSEKLTRASLDRVVLDHTAQRLYRARRTTT